MYSAAFKVVSVMSLIQVGFSNFWTPVSYESYENDPESTGLFEKVSLFISAAMFVVGMLIIVFKDVIFLLLAKSYRQAAGISSFLLLIPIMNTTSQVTGVGIGFKNVIVAFINTFVGNLVWQVLSAVIGLVTTLLVYKAEVKYVLDIVVE